MIQIWKIVLPLQIMMKKQNYTLIILLKLATMFVYRFIFFIWGFRKGVIFCIIFPENINVSGIIILFSGNIFLCFPESILFIQKTHKNQENSVRFISFFWVYTTSRPWIWPKSNPEPMDRPRLFKNLDLYNMYILFWKSFIFRKCIFL